MYAIPWEPVLLVLTVAVLVASVAPPRVLTFLCPFIGPEHLRPSEAIGGAHPVTRKTPVWKILVLVSLAASEAAGWVFFAALSFASPNPAQTSLLVGEAATMVLCWSYLTLVPFLQPPTTAPFGLLLLYLAHASYTFYQFLLALLTNTDSPIWSSNILLHFFALVPEAVLVLTALSFPLQPFAPPPAKEGGPVRGPEDYVNVLSWITFSWVSPLVATGRARKLDEVDISDLSPIMETEIVARRFREVKSPTLLRTLLAANSSDLTIYLLLSIFSSLLIYVAPYLLQRILEALESPSPLARRQAFVLALLGLATSIIKSDTDLFGSWYSRRASIRARSILISAIYRKALRRRDMSGVVGQRAKEAAVMNQLVMVGYFVTAPFELVVATSFLYKLLGWSAFAGLSVIALAVPLNFWISQLEIKMNRHMRAARDSRMTSVTEIIESCRTIKYFAWENVWLDRVFKARDVELAWLLRNRVVGILMTILWTIIPDAISLVAFFCFTKLAKRDLTIPIAFTALALLNQIRQPLTNVPQGIFGLVQTYISIKRIDGYLNEPEVPEWVSSLEQIDTSESQRIALDDASFVWAHKSVDSGSNGPATSATPELVLPTLNLAVAPGTTTPTPEPRVFELRNVSVDFPIGALSLITGPTGSGKTALLMALLGEINCTGGSIYLPKNFLAHGEDGLSNSTAFCAQKPWLEHTSIQNNILFGAELDQARYDEVLDACALRPDLAVLEDGDLTEIGEKGVSLSGGQKARVALARAAYSRARHVLLDDPLSAVDHHTAKHLYDKLFLGPICEGRTIILVTHHVTLCLPTARYLVSLSEGAVSQAIQDPSTSDPAALAIAAEAAKEDIGAEDVASGSQSLSISEDSESTAPVSREDIAAGKISDPSVVPKAPRKLVVDEARSAGNVKWRVYRTYLSEFGWWLWGAIVLLLALARVVPVAQQFWLKFWGESYADSINLFVGALVNVGQTSLAPHPLAEGTISASTLSATHRWFNFPPANENPDPYLWVYFAISIAYAGTVLLVHIVQTWGAIRAARTLFRKTLARVVRAPSRWFDTTPVGRILNRFSSDFETVDWQLDKSVQEVLFTGFGLISAFLVIFITIPSFIIPALFVVAAYMNLGYSYVRTARDVRRMMNNSRSPIFSTFGETLAGIVTIRAFSAENRYLSGLFQKVDAFAKMDWAFWMTNRFMFVRLDCIGAFSVFGTTVFALASGSNSGLAALAIVSARSLVQNVYWLVRFATSLEVDLNAVERIDELLHTEQEPPSIIETNRPSANWPSDVGGLEIEDLVVRYAPDLPAVIQGVTVSFAPRQKIGVVGRTGSGKSTLAMSLLRFVDPSEGKIVLDGVDITAIGLSDLRSKVTIIPQEAVLFSGTVRSNIDPFSEHEDADLWDVLESVRLSNNSSRPSAAPTPPRVESSTNLAAGEVDTPRAPTPAGTGRISITSLDAPVSAGGGNFSQGQRQLLAMARSLLRRSKVIIMDEATASVDFETDAIIQTAIREGFKDALVITIAHRLQTVIDYDKILVMDAGRVAEFDTPKNLLLKPDGIFRSMCMKGADWDEVKRRTGVE